MSNPIKVYDFVEVSPTSAPLPYEEPKTIGMPPKSQPLTSTVEILIGQNEDLMSRLKVNLRRNVQLEQETMELRQKLQETLEHQLAIQASGDIWTEKEKFWLADRDDLKQEIENLRKIQYQLRFENNILRNFRRRIQNWVKNRFKQNLYNAKKYELLWNNLKIETRKKDERLLDYQSKNEHLTQQLTRAESVFRNDSAALVERYENALRNAQQELTKLKQDNSILLSQASIVSESSKQVTELQNRLVSVEKRALTAEAELTTALREKTELEVLRQQLQENLDKTSINLSMTESELKSTQEQAKAMNNLWSELQSEADSLRSQNRALIQINQDLGSKINSAPRSKDDSDRHLARLAEVDQILNQIETTVFGKRPNP